MRKHLAITTLSAIEAILTGKKTIETRFSQKKIPPFEVVGRGDVVYLKPPGKEVKGEFRVKKVFFYEGLTPEDIDKIFQDYGKKIRVGNEAEDQKYYQNKKNSLYGSLIFIGESDRFLTSPIKVKKKDLRGWVVLK